MLYCSPETYGHVRRSPSRRLGCAALRRPPAAVLHLRPRRLSSGRSCASTAAWASTTDTCSRSPCTHTSACAHTQTYAHLSFSSAVAPVINIFVCVRVEGERAPLAFGLLGVLRVQDFTAPAKQLLREEQTSLLQVGLLQVRQKQNKTTE